MTVKNEGLRQLWLSRTNDWLESGSTQETWCQSKQISVSTLRYWLHKFKKEKETEQSPRWLKVHTSQVNSAITELAVSTTEPPVKDTIKVRYQDMVIEFTNDCQLESVGRLLLMLRSL